MPSMPIHREYLPDPLPPEPMALVAEWLAAATRLALQPNPNAMVLATADADGHPSARVVLCKALQPQAGYLTFFSNYESRKGRELAANSHAAVVMHWDAMHRQVRIEGRITRTTAAESDAYFAARPWQSQIGAWASEQSAAIGSRAQLEAAVALTAARFGAPTPVVDPGNTAGGIAGSTSTGGTVADAVPVIPRPPHWGGYRLWAQSVELWVEGSGRIHDRARWTRELTADAVGFTAGPWSALRLQP